jgi:glycosyltransferase involved in cell wall biosynthesis
MRLLIVIPARNEAASLPRVVEDLRRRAPPGDVLVVDDASDDETAELLPRLGVRRLRLGRRMGIGGAVRAGLRYAQRMGFDTVVRFDGDGQHLAREIPRLLEPLAAGRAEAVLGSRYLAASVSAGYRSAGLRRAGKRRLAALMSLATGRTLTDPTSGFWAFGPRLVELLARHHPTGYPEPELLLFLHRNGCRVVEVATEMGPRLAGRTSLTALRALQALARVVLALVIVPLRATVGGDE